MRPITAVLLGAGGRGRFAYGAFAEQFPRELAFVAVADPDKERREWFASRHGIAAESAFEGWEDVLEREKMADIAVICTQDRMHFAPTMKALQKGYHVLLEKPMSPLPEECVKMEDEARKHDRLLTICHVLRYSPFWQTIKRMLQAGRIGKPVSLQLNENVGYYHIAHSFVRGQWRNADHSSPMILAKSCHDLDLIGWLMEQPCVRVSSYGSLSHFRREHMPEGAAERCTDGCAAEERCPYSSLKIYLRPEGEEWARFITQDLSRDGIVQALESGPFGRCVYRCDNNVVDHQAVNMEFADGATASFVMSGFTHDCTRQVQIMGTHGEIRGVMEENLIRVYDFAANDRQDYTIVPPGGMHGGGDEELMRSFLREVRSYSGGESLTSAAASVQSHLMAFAAERSRLENGRSIDLAAYKAELLYSDRGVKGRR